MRSEKPHFLIRPDDYPDDLPWDVSAAEKGHGYQAWVMDQVRPLLGKRILELGCGSGNMSRWFQHADRLVLTEMESSSVKLVRRMLPHWFKKGQKISVKQMALPNRGLDRLAHENFDTVISFNVLEHIERDDLVFEQCIRLLRKSKAKGPRRMISFVPAHPFAYGTLDKRAGHFRRYTRQRLQQFHRQFCPEAEFKARSFNFPGLWGWWLNGRVIKQKKVGEGTIGLFENLLPLIRPCDALVTGFLKIPLGQSLIASVTLPPRDTP